MTTQANDLVDYRGDVYELHGGGSLFDPEALGIDFRPLSTDAWRGYKMRFAVVDDAIFLEGLELSAVAGTAYPVLGGRTPVVRNAGTLALYQSLRLALNYDGKVTLTSGFDYATRIHGMPFTFPFQYERVLHLDLRAGKIQHIHDDSERVARLRRELAARVPAGPRDPAYLDLAVELDASLR